MALTLSMADGLKAADCPAERQPTVPQSGEPAINIDKHKKQLRAYHDDIAPGDSSSAYIKDIKLVTGDALTHVLSRYDKVKMPAIVLDIDETSLTNWPNLDANDFGFIKGGQCSLQPAHACGFDAWIRKGTAPKIDATLNLFNAVRAKQVAVFFVTGRRDSQRRVTVRNLKRAGYKGWTGLMTRPDGDKDKSIVPFKSGRRAMIQDKGYTIIANIGDQKSDLDGEYADCKFKMPNPFYLIE
jgi:acid phosphatase